VNKFTDDDLNHVKYTYTNMSKRGDRLLMRIVARLEAVEEYARECRELGADDTELFNVWLQSKGE
jgi:hypothetical protein